MLGNQEPTFFYQNNSKMRYEFDPKQYLFIMFSSSVIFRCVYRVLISYWSMSNPIFQFSFYNPFAFRATHTYAHIILDNIKYNMIR